MRASADVDDDEWQAVYLAHPDNWDELTPFKQQRDSTTVANPSVALSRRNRVAVKVAVKSRLYSVAEVYWPNIWWCG